VIFFVVVGIFFTTVELAVQLETAATQRVVGCPESGD